MYAWCVYDPYDPEKHSPYDEPIGLGGAGFIGLLGGALWPVVESGRCLCWMADNKHETLETIILAEPRGVKKERKNKELRARINELEAELGL